MTRKDIIKREHQSKRPLQIAKEIKVVLSKVFAKGAIKDADLFGKFVLVSHVEVSSDLSYAKVFVYGQGVAESNEKLLKALNRNNAFFRKQVSGHLTTRNSPKIIFHIDNHFDNLEEAKRILDQIPPEDLIDKDENNGK